MDDLTRKPKDESVFLFLADQIRSFGLSSDKVVEVLKKLIRLMERRS